MSGTLSMAALDSFARGLMLAPEHTQREMLAAMTQASLRVEAAVKDFVPRATGLTAASVTSDAFSTPAGVLGVVGSALASATFVELGTKAHMPPVAALIPWVQAVLGVDAKRAPSVAYLVARKIARKGTKAQKPFEKGLNASQAEIARLFEAAAERVSAHIVRGMA